MASGTRLVMTVGTDNGNRTLSYNYASDTAEKNDIDNFGAVIVTNSDLFSIEPKSYVGSKLVTTTERIVTETTTA